MTGSHYEISPREREDEQRRHRDEFDAPDESYDDYMARLSERPRAGESPSSGLDSTTASGTGRSESRDDRETA